MASKDYAHVETDKELAELESRIAQVYADAAAEMKVTVDDYFDSYAKRYEQYLNEYNAGNITKEEFQQWELNQIGRGERYEAMRDALAERFVNADEVAMAYVNDATPSIYSLNRNYSNYAINQYDPELDFGLWDESTVRNLIVNQPDLMPYYPKAKAVKRGIDLDYGKSQITKTVTSGILQGKSLTRIANDLMNRIEGMSRASALRSARTAITAAENAGRQDSFDEAADMGLKMEKVWLATLDSRTRVAHQKADMQVVKYDKTFDVGGEALMFPGDNTHGASGWNLYNCFVGETRVDTDSRIIRSYKSEYKGKLVKVKTSAGVEFTCTLNHPILTPSGWITANRLNEGDDILVALNRKSFPTMLRRNMNIDHIHPSMEALHNSFRSYGSVHRESALCVNFHGDIPTSDVEVVTEKRLLRNNRNSCIRKGFNKFLFKSSNESFVSKSSFMEHLRSIRTATFCLVRRLNKSFSLLWRRLSHSDVHGFRPVSDGSITLPEYSINDLPADTEIRGKLLDGLSSKVFVDKIISINISDSFCHVYNLQTKNGYYFVNNIVAQNSTKDNGISAIAKNCRCTVFEKPEGMSMDDFERWARDPETGAREQVTGQSYEDWLKSKNGGEAFDEQESLQERYERNQDAIKETLSNIEESRRNLDHEVGTVIDLDGNILNETNGEAHQVDMSGMDLSGEIFTHNHPSGGCFSTGDLESFIDSGLYEMRASTPQGTYYSLKNESGGEISNSLVKDYEKSGNIIEAMNNITADLKSGVLKKEDYDFTTVAQYQGKLQSEFLSEHASDYGLTFSTGEI